MNGRDQCGYNNHLPAPELSETTSLTENEDFVKNLPSIPPTATSNESTLTPQFNNPSIKKIVEVLFSRSEARAREKVFTHNPGAKVSEATGSVTSILQ
jgi:hypothetical protein